MRDARSCRSAPVVMGCRACGLSSCASSSARHTIRAMVCTDSRGYAPDALSAESITASAPANTACATSEASARVGVGVLIIDSSICVATTTGLPCLREISMIFRCQPGTSSAGNSTPKSPRATMSASAACAISSSSRSACGFSIFAMMAARSPTKPRSSCTSAARCTNDKATQSTPSAKPKARSSRSLRVKEDKESGVSGRFTPLRSESMPPTNTSASNAKSCLAFKRSLSLPSSINNTWPTCNSSTISACGKGTSPGLC